MVDRQSGLFGAVAEVIRRRQTAKLLADPDRPVSFDPGGCEEHDRTVREAVAAAGWAPFHFARNVGGVAEPWRVRILWHRACQELAARLPSLVEIPPKNRVRQLLSGCGAMILVTWLPADSTGEPEKRRSVDAEHLCAAAALTQNLLLLLEAAGFANYWASAGLLDQPPVRDALGVPVGEAIVAAVYAGYPLPAGAAVERLEGANRSQRQGPAAWCRELHSIG